MAHPKTKPPARILVVDDHPLIRGGFVQWLTGERDLEICGEAGSAGETILAVDNDPPPDLVVLDLMLGHSDGLELIKQIRTLRPGLPVLVMSVHDELIYAERALRAGANGYVMKKEPQEAFLGAVRAVLAGRIHVSPRMQALLFEKGFSTDPCKLLVPEANPPLSDRELHVFRLIGAGLSTKQIALELHLSGKTVETHRANIKIKLGLESGAAMVSAAKRWLEAPETAVFPAAAHASRRGG